MKFGEYVKSLQEFMEKNKGSEKLIVITASDDEGNSYSKIYYGPSLGNYNNNEYEPFNVEENSEKDINAVLVN